MSTGIKATVVIPTFNGEEFLSELLKALRKQTAPFDYEVLVIDSGSTDATLGIIEKFEEVRLHQIPNSEFGHGKTRNLGASMAKGEIVVFLTQDAVPATKKWLEYMVEPFELDERIACVFGKQVPRGQCIVPIKREVFSAFHALGPDHSLMVHRGASLISGNSVQISTTFFSDVNSAVRREFLANKIPFRDVNYAEDQALGMDVLEAGYLKVYTPFGSVMHSHDYKLRKYFHRKYDEYVGLIQTGHSIRNARFLSAVKEVVITTLLDWRFAMKDPHYSWKRKPYNLVMAPPYNLARVLAMQIATRKKLRERFGADLSLEAKAKKKTD